MARSDHRFNYRWRLSDGFPAPGIAPNGLKVFGTFVCGGGSAMGYKLAGCDYLGGVEIDPKVAETYRENLRPKYLFVEDIRDFNKREDLPDELYHLDILDGSPPCTLFSVNRAKVREESWGKKKRFAEGQKEQTLDDLPFVWCDTVAKLRPKVCLMENVEGLAKGNAKAYLARIVGKLRETGYETQVFILDAQLMGVPQRRRRVFVIGRRTDLKIPSLNLDFSEPVIPFGEIEETDYEGHDRDLGNVRLSYWKALRPGDTFLGDGALRLSKVSQFSIPLADRTKVLPTITTRPAVLKHKPRQLTDLEILKGGVLSGGLQVREMPAYLSLRDERPSPHDRQHSLRDQPPAVRT